MSKSLISDKVSVIFEYGGNQESFLNVSDCEIFWSMDAGIVMRTANITGYENPKSKRLLVELNEVSKMVVYLYIEGKLFLKTFITDSMIRWNLSGNGLTFQFTLFDRFFPLKISDIIRTKPKSGMPLQSFIADCLHELAFDAPSFLNSYNRQIKKASDFIKNGSGVGEVVKLKTFKKDTFLAEDGKDLVAECLALSKVLLVSDGVDTLTLEKPNSNPFPIGFIDIQTDNNIYYIGNQSERKEGEITPRAVMLLNSFDSGSGENNPVLVDNTFGYPNYFKIHQVSYKATSQQLRDMINYGLADIKTRQNSFFIGLKNRVFDDNGNFFQPNRKINVFIPQMGFKHNLIILAMSASISESGTELKLNISSEDAFENNATLRQKLSLL